MSDELANALQDQRVHNNGKHGGRILLAMTDAGWDRIISSLRSGSRRDGLLEAAKFFAQADEHIIWYTDVIVAELRALAAQEDQRSHVLEERPVNEPEKVHETTDCGCAQPLTNCSEEPTCKVMRKILNQPQEPIAERIGDKLPTYYLNAAEQEVLRRALMRSAKPQEQSYEEQSDGTITPVDPTDKGVDVLKEQSADDLLREKIEHWREYWNGDYNEKAMADALDYLMTEFDAHLSKEV